MESFVKVLLALICSQGHSQRGREVYAQIKPVKAGDVLEQSNLQFSIDLYQESVKREGNVFFSPWSLQTTLGMVYAGAEGRTKSQMQKALSFPSNNSDDLIYEGLHRNLISIQDTNSVDFSLDAGNRVFVSNDTTLKPGYQTILQNTFQSGASGVNFRNESNEIREDINAWVRQKTQGKILELIPNGALGPDTKMVLVNAIYFKGTWLTQFKAEKTLPSDFHISKDRSVQTDMMNLETKIRVGHLDDPKLQVFELPYDGARLSMIVFLPEENDGLKEVERKLTADTLKRAMRSLDIHNVNLLFPKFKIEHTLPAKDLLIQLGMRDLFSQSADLSGMTGQRDIQVSDIFHKALVEINEEGTIAAASSGIVVVPLSLSYPSPETIFVRADHPFIFFIYDFETSQVLFMGRIMDPRPESSVPPSLSNMQSWPQTGSSSFTFPPRKQSWSQQTSSAFTFPPGKQSWSQLGSTALTYPSMNPLRTETEADDINNRQPSRSQSVPFSSHLSSNPSTARIYTQWFDSPQHKWPYMYRVPQNPQLVFLRSRVYRSPFTPVFQRHKMLKRRYEDQPIHPQ